MPQTIKKTADSGVAIILFDIPRKPSHSDLIVTNIGIVRDVSQQVAMYSFNAVIVVSNLLDVFYYCAWKSSGFSSNKVLGMRGQLDMA